MVGVAVSLMAGIEWWRQAAGAGIPNKDTAGLPAQSPRIHGYAATRESHKAAGMTLEQLMEKLPPEFFSAGLSKEELLVEHALLRRLGELMGEDALSFLLDRYPECDSHQKLFGFVLEGWAKSEPAAAAAALGDMLKEMNEHGKAKWKGRQLGDGIGRGIFGFDKYFHFMCQQAVTAITARDQDAAYALLTSGVLQEANTSLVWDYVMALPSHTDWEKLHAQLQKNFPAEKGRGAPHEFVIATAWAKSDIDRALAWLRAQNSKANTNHYQYGFLRVADGLETAYHTHFALRLGPSELQVERYSADLYDWMKRHYGTEAFDDKLLALYADRLIRRGKKRGLDERRAEIINLAADESSRCGLLLDIVNIGTPKSKSHKNVHPLDYPPIDALIKLAELTNLSDSKRREVLERIDEIQAMRMAAGE